MIVSVKPVQCTFLQKVYFLRNMSGLTEFPPLISLLFNQQIIFKHYIWHGI